MISMLLFSEKPIPAAAHPEYELSIETTTGISAPPIGMMISTPSTKLRASIAKNALQLPVNVNTSPSPIVTSPSTRFSRCWPANTTGAPWNRRNL